MLEKEGGVEMCVEEDRRLKLRRVNLQRRSNAKLVSVCYLCGSGCAGRFGAAITSRRCSTTDLADPKIIVNLIIDEPAAG